MLSSARPAANADTLICRSTSGRSRESLLLAGVDDGVDGAPGVAAEAAAADLADVPAGPRRGGELGHGLGELREEGVLALRELPHDGRRGAVLDERHVGGEHALAVHQRPVVPVVEQVGGHHVQVLWPGRGGAAVGRQPPGEGVVHALGPVGEERAARPPDGVGAGERHQVGEVAEALGAEGAGEGGDAGGCRRREAVDDVRRRRGEAVELALRHGVVGAAGEHDGVAGGERRDVGARHGGAARRVHLGADVLHELQRARLQRGVGPHGLLRAAALEVHGRVAALWEAVVEEDAEQAGGERHLTLERRLHGGPHDALQLRARRRVEAGAVQTGGQGWGEQNGDGNEGQNQ
uniref:Uncharacterized protein n=1 Tax=Triticum urartu TaxID=4572 RepID=A0A8R7PLJ9_TRIUA